MFSPVPEFIAAVIPITRSSRRHSCTRALPNTWVYCGGVGLPCDGFPDATAGTPFAIDFGLAACHFSMPSSPPSSEGANPLPLTVAQWITTGRWAISASRRARLTARTSWPSITPMYTKSSSSHHRPGAQNALIDSLTWGPRRSNAGPMPTGSLVSPSSNPSRARHSLGLSRTRLNCRESAPTFGAIDIPLSLRTTTIGVPRPPA